MRLIGVLLVILLFPLQGACEQRRAKEAKLASYCVGIKTSRAEAGRFFEIMDRFAIEQSLLIDRAPSMHSYSNREKTVLITVEGYMGDIGSVLALHEKRPDGDFYRKILEEYVAGNVGVHWSVTNCNEIPGYKGPWIVE